MTQGDLPVTADAFEQNHSHAPSPKTIKLFDKYINNEENKSYLRFIIVGLRKGRENDEGNMNAEGIQLAFKNQMKVAFKFIPICMFTHNNCCVELIVEEKTVPALKAAFVTFQTSEEMATYFGQATMYSQLEWNCFLARPSNKILLKKECHGLRKSIISLGLDLKAYSRPRYFGTVSYCWMGALKQLNGNGFNQKAFKIQIIKDIDKLIASNQFRFQPMINSDQLANTDFSALENAFGLNVIEERNETDDIQSNQSVAPSSSVSQQMIASLEHHHQTLRPTASEIQSNQVTPRPANSTIESPLQKRQKTNPTPKPPQYEVIDSQGYTIYTWKPNLTLQQAIRNRQFKYLVYNMKNCKKLDAIVNPNTTIFIVNESVQDIKVFCEYNDTKWVMTVPMDASANHFLPLEIKNNPSSYDVSIVTTDFQGTIAFQAIKSVKMKSVNTTSNYCFFFKFLDQGTRCIEFNSSSLLWHDICDTVMPKGQSIRNRKWIIQLNHKTTLNPNFKIFPQDTVQICGYQPGGSTNVKHQNPFEILAEQTLISNQQLSENVPLTRSKNESKLYFRHLRSFEEVSEPQFEFENGFKAAYLNINGIKHKEAFILNQIEKYEPDLFFVSETRLKDTSWLPASFVVKASCTPTSQYGMCLAINHLKYKKGDIRVLSKRFDHILIQVGALRIMGVYLPANVRDKAAYFHNLYKIGGSNCIYLGDVNVGASHDNPTSKYQSFADYIYSKNLEIILPLNSNFSYCRYNSDQCSLLDYALTPTSSDYRTQLHCFPQTCSDHLSICLEIDLHDFSKDLIVVKESKLKVYKFNQSIKDSNGNVEFPNREHFKCISAARLRQISPEFYQNLSSHQPASSSYH
eukprot:NODE_360_length_8799_cov_0.293448.p1 type:complete len:858 gc:universal NODE_360_length_8799_cov_0.293448:8492-5919(-)